MSNEGVNVGQNSESFIYNDNKVKVIREIIKDKPVSIIDNNSEYSSVILELGLDVQIDKNI